MPSFGIYIPEGSDLERKINFKAKKFHDGKVSAYVRKCVEKDLDGSYEVTANTSLLDLARQFRPALVSRLERYNLEDQALILDRFLEAFADALFVAATAAVVTWALWAYARRKSKDTRNEDVNDHEM